MADAFGTVLVIVVIVSLIAATWAFLGSGTALRQVGRGGLTLDHGSERTSPDPRSPAGRAEREAEIRQLLQARNARRQARGDAPVDVEAEIAALVALPAPADPALASEVRQLVIARNARRVRAGKPPLDVENETARQLRRLP